MDSFSDLLFARPSFLTGVARLFDVGRSLNTYNISSSPEEADAYAIASDWAAVGQDMQEAIGQFTESPEWQEHAR